MKKIRANTTTRTILSPSSSLSSSSPHFHPYHHYSLITKIGFSEFAIFFIIISLLLFRSPIAESILPSSLSSNFPDQGSLMVDGCPNATTLVPCQCNQTKFEITCGNGITSSTDLRYVFRDASLQRNPYATNNHLRYAHLIFENTPIERLFSRSFDPFTFIAITIRHNYYLSSFDESAFYPTNQVTTTVKFDSNAKLGSHNDSIVSLFTAIKSFINLDMLLIHNCGLLFIPPDAFNGLASQQSLKRISLIGNDIQIIQSDAFVGLPSLRYLALSQNQLRRIEPNAINLRTNICGPLYTKYDKSYYNIDLNANQLDPESLHPTSIQVDCSTELNLSNNLITYLPAPVFRPLFRHFLKINLLGNRLDCANCNMSWLLKGRFCPSYNSTIRYHSLVESPCDSNMLAIFVERCAVQFADRTRSSSNDDSAVDGEVTSITTNDTDNFELDRNLLLCPEDKPYGLSSSSTSKYVSVISRIIHLTVILYFDFFLHLIVIVP